MSYSMSKWFFITFVGLALFGCAETTVKREGAAPPVGKKFDYSGHLGLETKTQPTGNSTVPSIVATRPVNITPVIEKPLPVYSLTAIDSPVQDILYHLASISKHQIDIWQGVDGNLTINAVSQPLEKILQRIADQLDLIATVNDRHIEVKPDKPFWKHYQVDYVNITRSSRDSIVMNMTVGGSVNGASNQSNGSRSSVEKVSDHNFWQTLRTNLIMMTQSPRQVTNSGGLQTATGVNNLTTAAPTTSSPIAAVAAAMTGGTPAVATPSTATQATPVTSNLQTQASVVVNPEAGLVLVYANAKRHQMVQAYLDNVVKRVERQVLIEASVIEVMLSDSYQAGIDWSNSGFRNLANRTAIPGDTVFTATMPNNVGIDLTLGLKMLQEFGDVKVLSSPKIMAVNNQSALLKVVDNEVYFTVTVSRTSPTAGSPEVATFETTVHTVPVGFMMSVTPFVSEQKEVSLNIRPTISRIINYRSDPNPELKKENVESLIPVIQEREMETVLKLRDQQTAVIGGLIEDRRSDRTSGLAWLSKIPLIGSSLFGNRSNEMGKSELVIFIRPVIVERPDVHSGDLSHFGEFLRQKTEASQ